MKTLLLAMTLTLSFASQASACGSDTPPSDANVLTSSQDSSTMTIEAKSVDANNPDLLAIRFADITSDARKIVVVDEEGNQIRAEVFAMYKCLDTPGITEVFYLNAPKDATFTIYLLADESEEFWLRRPDMILSDKSLKVYVSYAEDLANQRASEKKSQ